ncbi:MAG: DUF1501 domain-containing protein [Lentisphaeraceae bacterium]|nr:DUF1501 domain-containing protein [Lentisphaeraceae bacterium]
MKDLLLKSDEMSRRKFAMGMATNFLGLSMISSVAHAASTPTIKGGGKAKSVIFIRVVGGLSHVDSFDIKEANKDAMKASAPIKSSADGIRVGKDFSKMAKHMDKFAVINSMHHTQGVHTHASYLMDKSYEKRGTIVHPDLGAWVSKHGTRRSGDIPPFVKVGKVGSLGTGFFSAKHSALPIKAPTKGIQYSKLAKGVSSEEFDRRGHLLNIVNGEYEKKLKNKITGDYNQAYNDAMKLMNSKDLEVFNVAKEDAKTREVYGKSDFGSSCLLARRLVEKGVSYVQLTHGNWDDHTEIYKNFPGRATDLDQGVAALMADLNSRGLLDSTLVVFTTEFGRTAELDKRGGRGHNPIGYTSMLAGAGVKGGQKYGETDSQGKRAIKDKVGTDDFNATIAHAMGLPLGHVEMSPTGRPFKIADKGKPLTMLF